MRFNWHVSVPLKEIGKSRIVLAAKCYGFAATPLRPRLIFAAHLLPSTAAMLRVNPNHHFDT